ncbi:MAG: rubrerythrin [Acutalibacteraceae bacterium]
MEDKHRVDITTRDRMLMAWERSMELVRSLEEQAEEIDDDERARAMFRRFAKDECVHASELHDRLLEYQGK